MLRWLQNGGASMLICFVVIHCTCTARILCTYCWWFAEPGSYTHMRTSRVSGSLYVSTLLPSMHCSALSVQRWSLIGCICSFIHQLQAVIRMLPTVLNNQLLWNWKAAPSCRHVWCQGFGKVGLLDITHTIDVTPAVQTSAIRGIVLLFRPWMAAWTWRPAWTSAWRSSTASPMTCGALWGPIPPRTGSRRWVKLSVCGSVACVFACACVFALMFLLELSRTTFLRSGSHRWVELSLCVHVACICLLLVYVGADVSVFRALRANHPQNRLTQVGWSEFCSLVALFHVKYVLKCSTFWGPALLKTDSHWWVELVLNM